MRRIIPTLVAVFLVMGAAPDAAWSADRYKIDPVHTSVGFAVRHLIISKVRGRFNEFSGTIVYDEDDITKSSVAFTIKAASIDTRHAKRDSDLRSPDFLDVKRFPTIAFRSEQVEKRGDGLVAVSSPRPDRIGRWCQSCRPQVLLPAPLGIRWPCRCSVCSLPMPVPG